MNSPFVLYNGHFYNSADSVIPAEHLRKILFRDAIRMNQTKLMFWESHLRLLLLHFNLFKLPLPYFLKNEAKELYRQIDRCLVKNKTYKSAVIHLTFFNEKLRTGYLIEIEPMDENQYTLREEGVYLSSYRDLYKSDSPISSLRLGSEAIWRLAESFVEPDEVPVILSGTNSLLEVPEANIFLIQNNVVCTPASATGAYVSPAKWLIEKLASSAGLSFMEEEHLTEAHLRQAEEVFICDDLQGIQYVRGFESKRYFKKKVLELADLFNQELI